MDLTILKKVYVFLYQIIKEMKQSFKRKFN